MLEFRIHLFYIRSLANAFYRLNRFDLNCTWSNKLFDSDNIEGGKSAPPNIISSPISLAERCAQTNEDSTKQHQYIVVSYP